MKIYSNLLIFSVQTICNKKPNGNIGYILTVIEEKNTAEVAQFMQQMLLYL